MVWLVSSKAGLTVTHPSIRFHKHQIDLRLQGEGDSTSTVGCYEERIHNT